MHRNLPAQGIRLNAIAPGYTETAMTKAVADDPQYGDAIRQFVASIPMQRARIPRRHGGCRRVFTQ